MSAAELAPGSLLAGFRIEALMGRGGMGVVYRATQLSLERPVALKLISPELAHEERFRERFLREARLAASLDHPHLLPVYEAGEAEGALFLAMRLVDGASLAELLRREGALPPERALRLFSQLASALQAAHEAGLLHRDVKPGNVLVAGAEEREHAYLCDFGLARRLSGGSLTQERAFLGTAAYAAPEQIRGEELDGRADLYALSCLLYECLTGASPFSAEDELALCWAHLHEPPPAPSSVDPSLAGFDPFFAQALAKDPEARFPSASELAQAAQAAGLAGALPAAPPTTGPPVKLPRPATPFLGRERELAEVLELLVQDEMRLLTLTGSGGTGKTRLALRAAEEAVPAFPDGVFWVSLAPLRDPSLVPAVVAQALEVPERPGAALTAAIVGAYTAKRALVLLDNCEHLVGAVADVVAALVEGCPQVVIAGSSRERLGLRAEHVYAVPPMGPSDSEALFFVRAHAAQPDFEADDHVPAICEAVDHLPLAVELAAARVRSLSTQAILKRLDERLSLLATRDRDVDERQRTLAATIAWSYELLGAEEQRAFRALSMFAGGCTLEAAEQVAGADLDLLESLLDKSLVRHRVDGAGQDRYWMLETIREFAAHELEHQVEAEVVRDRHAAWVLELLRETAPRWGDPALQAALDRVRVDEGNIRVALSRAIGKRDGSQALELVGLIGRTWWESGRLMEIQAWAKDALALGGDAHLEGTALLSSGVAYFPAEAESFATAAERFQVAGMPREAAYATMWLGLAEGQMGFVDRGLELLEAALAEFERLGDEYCASITRWNIDGVKGLRWPLDPAEARRLADTGREAAAESRRIGDPGDEIASLDFLSHALIDAGELDEAWSTALHAAALMREGRAGWHTLVSIVATLVRSAGLRGNAEQAVQLAGALRSVSSELGSTLALTRTAALEAAEASSREALDDEAAARATAAGEAMTVESLLEYLGTLE